MRYLIYCDPGSSSRCARVMLRTYRHQGGTPVSYESNRIHTPDTDQPIGSSGHEALELLDSLAKAAGIRDGDEFEVAVTPTGKRPHGDRWYVEDEFRQFRPETDDECLERIDRDGDQSKPGEV